MSVAERQERFSEAKSPLRFGTIVIVGGGCYGSYYLRQLRRAAAAHAVEWERVLVIDRDDNCAIASDVRGGNDGIELVSQEWQRFFQSYLDAAAENRVGSAGDAIVPSPLMPHLMFHWIVERARRRWPGREVGARPLQSPPPTPWQRATNDGPHYVSFAEWICPINCVEPRICPHTRAPRTWTLPETARRYVDSEHGEGRRLAGPVIFHCTHRAYGVGMFDTREVVAGDDLVQSVAQHNAAEVLVGTMSHCHGAFERLVIGPPNA